MSAPLMPIPVTCLPGAGKTTRLFRLLLQPALARNNVEKDFARYYALEAMEARQ